ncbi:MAG: hypothetical protein NT136_02435 [Candidatus Moranbacteria bacterium]|nr:hypothetical protein [Candidatus Moranbacteria bacterium]
MSALIKKLKKKGHFIAAIEQDEKSISYEKFQPRISLVLVVGNEPLGIDKRILKICDKIIEIPMRGKKESLNVAVALGIVGFSIRDSLEKKSGEKYERKK